MPSAKKQPKAKKSNVVPLNLPKDVVLAPQAEIPRHSFGKDQSSGKGKSKVHELSWSEFDQKVQKLALSVHESFRPDAVVGVAHGGVFVGGALASALSAEFFPVRLSMRSRDGLSKQKGNLNAKLPAELSGKRVLVVDDVAGSGDSLRLAIELSKEAGAKTVKSASLLSRQGGFAPDFTSTVTADFHVFPWDYAPVTASGDDSDPDTAGA